METNWEAGKKVSEEEEIMPQLSICIGNIGCGKSLLASKLAKMDYVVVNMDTISMMIGGGEYGLYDSKKKEIYHAAENAAIETALKSGFSVVVDRTNMDRKRRKNFIETGKRHAAEIVAYDWGPGDSSEVDKRIESPNGIPAETWRNVYEFMKQSYEPPSLEEGFSQIIEVPQRFRFHAFDFDGTIVENKFPEIGEIIFGRVERMNQLWEDLSNIIIIWSCRNGDYENQMRAFLLKNKIPFDFINENPIFDTGSRKIFAHEYHDDRNCILKK